MFADPFRFTPSPVGVAARGGRTSSCDAIFTFHPRRHGILIMSSRLDSTQFQTESSPMSSTGAPFHRLLNNGSTTALPALPMMFFIIVVVVSPQCHLVVCAGENRAEIPKAAAVAHL